MKLKVAWLAPYNLNQFAHKLEEDVSGTVNSATWIRNGALALAQCEDIELHILTQHKRLEVDYSFSENGIVFHLFRNGLKNIPRPLVLYQLDKEKLYRCLRQIGPDVVHGHGTENVYSYVAVTSGFPSVISIQGIVSQLFKRHRRISRLCFEHFVVQFIERYTIRQGRDFIIKAPFVKEMISSLNPGASVSLIENIVHEEFFNVNVAPNREKKKILFVGTLTSAKGTEELISSFHEVTAKYPDVELHLIGPSGLPYVDKVVLPLIQGGEGKNRIFLRGQLSSAAIASEFRGSAMLVLPSHFETSPNVVAEAMVAGLPVIGTDVGGIPFMIRNNETGQIVPPRDITSLTRAMEHYLAHPEIACTHSMSAMREGRIRFCKETYVQKTLEVYRSVIRRSAV